MTADEIRGTAVERINMSESRPTISLRHIPEALVILRKELERQQEWHNTRSVVVSGAYVDCSAEDEEYALELERLNPARLKLAKKLIEGAAVLPYPEGWLKDAALLLGVEVRP